jgi:hypothetical protein
MDHAVRILRNHNKDHPRQEEEKHIYITMANIVKGTGTMALAAFDSGAVLKKHEFGRPPPGPTDIQIDIKSCGMCHR